MREILKKLNRQGDEFIEQHGIEDFHKKAAELLSSADLLSSYDFQDLVKFSLQHNETQHYAHLDFSDLPLTLCMGQHCFIDVYFWLRRPTVIHNHHFAGAFMCLEGNNLDFEFTFQKERMLGDFHDLGTLNLKRERNMRPGDIEEIDFMDKFIHQNHHQADLTVNLCFRSFQKKQSNLSNYLFSGLRFEKAPALLEKVERLERMIHLGMVKEKDLTLPSDEAISFLLQTFERRDQNSRILNIRKHFHSRVKDEVGIEIDELLLLHHKHFEEVESHYE